MKCKDPWYDQESECWRCAACTRVLRYETPEGGVSWGDDEELPEGCPGEAQ